MYGSARSDSDDVLVDFHDVFGGPPRRVSIQEWRNSNGGERGEGRTTAAEAACRGDPWKAQGEKLVFGGESHALCGGSRRRLNVSEDFFDDIFGGSDSGGSATGGRNSDMFSGSPRSWVLSPVKPLPESLGSSSVPVQFSLPDKVRRPMDSPSVGGLNGASYTNSSKASSLRHQRTTTQVQEDIKKGTRPFYSPIPLSPKLVFGSEESLSSIKPGDEGVEKEHTKNSQGVADISQFHFSIYRWASKRAPIATPLRRVNSTRMREKASPESLYSDELDVNKENIVSSSTKKFVQMDTLSGVEHGMQDNDLTEKSSWKNEIGVQTVEEVTLPTDESKIQHTSVPNGSMEEEVRTDAVPPTTLHLHSPSVLYDEESGKGNHEDKDQKIGERHRKLRKSEPPSIPGSSASDDKPREEGSKSSNDGQVNKESVRRLGTDVGGNQSSDRVRGRVKEYIHVFNQDNLSKGKQDVRKQNEGIKEKERAIPSVRKPIHIVGKLDDVIKAQSFRKARDDGNTASNMHLQREENNSSKNLFSDASSEQKSSSESSTEYASDEIRATVIEVEESFHENFMIKELGKDEIKGREPDGVEDIQAIDEKIRRWSRGKEGNIRSLLSTLQYVLWPNSGWKPVPLVDIIEGPSVKRAYQKALLCLHPDKLQQKGAASHQKHAAHLVYEILQEAWAHFSSLGVL